MLNVTKIQRGNEAAAYVSERVVVAENEGNASVWRDELQNNGIT